MSIQRGTDILLKEKKALNKEAFGHVSQHTQLGLFMGQNAFEETLYSPSSLPFLVKVSENKSSANYRAQWS